MTEGEKTRIRFSLTSLYGKHVPYIRQKTYTRPVRSPIQSWSFFLNLKTVGVSALIIILASTSVTFAAENTLPGDLLFPIKVNVNEELRGALTISSQAKMDWEKERVVRRVEEAETLLKTDKFTDKRKTDAEVALKTQMETFALAARKTNEKNPNAVISATAELEPALKVHQEVIADLTSNSVSETEITNTILSTVALGIEATSKQENTAITTSVENNPDAFLALTDKKIADATLAIESSPVVISEIKAPEVIVQADIEPVISSKEMIAEKNEIEKTSIEQSSNTSNNVEKKSTSTPSEQKKELAPEPALLSMESSLALEVNNDKASNKEIEPEKSVGVKAKITTPSPSEILAKAKIKLQQAKELREKGEYKEALTLAQDAYKDIVALRLKDKISTKSKIDATKVEQKNKTQEEIKVNTLPDKQLESTANPKEEIKNIPAENSKNTIDIQKTETKTGVETKPTTTINVSIPVNSPINKIQSY